MLINDDIRGSHVVALRVRGSRGRALLERLQAPSARATSGVTLAGQTFGPVTETGRLTGPTRIAVVTRVAGIYSVRMPPASAAMLIVR